MVKYDEDGPMEVPVTLKKVPDLHPVVNRQTAAETKPQGSLL
jgi:hypothetical protein